GHDGRPATGPAPTRTPDPAHPAVAGVHSGPHHPPRPRQPQTAFASAVLAAAPLVPVSPAYPGATDRDRLPARTRAFASCGSSDQSRDRVAVIHVMRTINDIMPHGRGWDAQGMVDRGGHVLGFLRAAGGIGPKPVR